MKQEKLFTRKEMQEFAEAMVDIERKRYKGRITKICYWLKSIAWMNAHDTAWIEKTIEKLRRIK